MGGPRDALSWVSFSLSLVGGLAHHSVPCGLSTVLTLTVLPSSLPACMLRCGEYGWKNKIKGSTYVSTRRAKVAIVVTRVVVQGSRNVVYSGVEESVFG
jgi:hypothetical protein